MSNAALLWEMFLKISGANIKSKKMTSQEKKESIVNELLKIPKEKWDWHGSREICIYYDKFSLEKTINKRIVLRRSGEFKYSFEDSQNCELFFHIGGLIIDCGTRTSDAWELFMSVVQYSRTQDESSNQTAIDYVYKKIVL
mgnify:CR=1 FL=1